MSRRARDRRATGAQARARRTQPAGSAQDVLMAEVVVVGPDDGAPSTALGLALKDEGASARLAAAWAAYPKDLHQALADDLYERLVDNTNDFQSSSI